MPIMMAYILPTDPIIRYVDHASLRVTLRTLENRLKINAMEHFEIRFLLRILI